MGDIERCVVVFVLVVIRLVFWDISLTLAKREDVWREMTDVTDRMRTAQKMTREKKGD